MRHDVHLTILLHTTRGPQHQNTSPLPVYLAHLNAITSLLRDTVKAVDIHVYFAKSVSITKLFIS